MNKMYLIIISVFFFLLSSCGVGFEMDVDPMGAKFGYWVSYDIRGNETDDLSAVTMWKLQEEGIWVSSLRDKSSYSKKRYHYWGYAYNFCDKSNYGGFDDWRLPSIEELKYLRTKNIMTLSYKRGIEDISSYFVWSSSIGANPHQRAIISMREGLVYYEDENGSEGLFLCIRTEF